MTSSLLWSKIVIKTTTTSITITGMYIIYGSSLVCRYCKRLLFPVKYYEICSFCSVYQAVLGHSLYVLHSYIKIIFIKDSNLYLLHYCFH